MCRSAISIGVRAFKQLYTPFDWTKVLRGESDLDKINSASTTSHSAAPPPSKKVALGPAVADAPVDLVAQLRRGRSGAHFFTLIQILLLMGFFIL